MNKNIFVGTAFAFAFVIFGATPVLAVPHRPVPVCNIEGTIKSVESKDAYKLPCDTQPNICQEDGIYGYPDRYILGVDIKSVTNTFPNDTSASACESEYPVGNTEIFDISKSDVRTNDVFSVGKNIEATVVAFEATDITSYRLTDKIDADKSGTIRSFILSPLGISLGSILVLLVLSGIAYLIILFRRKKVEIAK